MSERVQPSLNRLTTLFSSDEGTSAVEYALLVGIIVGAGLLAAQSLGERLASSVSIASSALEHSNTSGQPAPAIQYATKHSVSQAQAAQSLLSQLLPLIVALAAVGLLIVQRRTAKDQPQQEGSDQSRGDQAEQPAYLAKRQEILRSMAADVRSLLQNRLLVRNVMSSTIHPVAPAMPAAEIKQLMAERRVHHLLVCTPDEQLLGIISDRDLPVRIGATAAELMTRDPAVVAPDVAITAAVSVMLKRRISSLPVVEHDRVVGIVTMTDVAMTLQCALQSLDKLSSELDQHGPAPQATSRKLRPAEGTSNQLAG